MKQIYALHAGAEILRFAEDDKRWGVSKGNRIFS